MLKTERMKQVVVAGAKPQLVPVIHTLQRLQVLHIEEHRPDDFFTYGDPLPEGERVAEARLSARGLVKSLGLEEKPPRERTEPITGWEDAVQAVEEVDQAVTGLIKEREATQSALREKEQEAARLRRLSGLGLRLEELSGYQNLKVFLGTTTSDPEPLLSEKLETHHLAKTPDENGFLVALFVPKSQAEEADNLLAQSGFAPVEIPTGHGPVDSAAGRAISEARRIRAHLEEQDARLETARTTHGARLLAAEKALTAAAERANAPLRFATSTNGFVVTGFVPVGSVQETERALQEATSHSLYIEWQTPTAPEHGHHDPKPAEESAHPAGHAPDAPMEPPSRFAHKRKGPSAFTHMLTMHSYPKYKEIDPTVLMYIVFPIFFAVMIGDLAFGVLIMLVAWFLRNHYPLGIGGPKVSRMLMLAGFWTTLFGVFVYAEAFGMHFVETPGHMSWEWLFGADWSAWYHAPAGYASGAAYVAAGGTPHLQIFDLSVAGIQLGQLGHLAKLENVVELLILSMGLALVHLNLAIFIGIYNQWILHGPKHAILGRVSWLIMELGVAGIAWGAHSGDTGITAAGWAGLALSVIMLIGGEGAIAILELPKLFSNALSYFRLAAVAMSKAGMALAVNTFGFVMLTDTTMAVNGVGGWVIIVLGHLVVLALGIIAGGLHSLRLQLVEFFNWFYEGGGRPFKAFGDPHLRQ